MPESALALLQSVPATLLLAIASGGIGTMFGIGLAFARLSGQPLLRAAAGIYIVVMRGTPLLVQLFVIYYGLPQFAAVREGPAWLLLRDPMAAAILAFALNVAAYFAEIVRGALLAVSRAEVEAGRAYGLHGIMLYRRVIAPIALRIALPGYGNEWIGLIKATSLASTVTVMELTGAASAIGATTFRPVGAFVIAGLFYLALTSALSALLGQIERGQSRHLRPLEAMR